MANFRALVSYNISRPHRLAASYTASIGETDKPVTGALKDSGPVFNDVLHCEGVFPDLVSAKVAVLRWMDCPARFVRVTFRVTDDSGRDCESVAYEMRPAIRRGER